MRIVFNRNTHDEKGEYRSPEYFGMLDVSKQYCERHNKTEPLTEQEEKEWDKKFDDASDFNREFGKQELFFGVHTFDKDDMTLEEIYKATHDMLTGGALCGKFDPKDPRLTIEGHLKALAFMIEHKLVKAEIRVA
jgi:hypothetical protein